MTSDFGLRVISKSSAASSWRRRLAILLFTEPRVMAADPGGRAASTSTMVDMGGLEGDGEHNIDTGLTLRYGGGSRMNIRILRRL